MTRIKDAKVKEKSGGYHRLFGNDALGDLASRIQSAVISSRSELVKLILERAVQIKDLDEFLQRKVIPYGVRIATKEQISKSKIIKTTKKPKPDFLIIQRRKRKLNYYAIVLKDGHQFDTSTAENEKTKINLFMKNNLGLLSSRLSTHICCFNQDSKEAIIAGFKNKIVLKEAMTGKEFCALLEIDYDEIVEVRKRDQPENIRDFLLELTKIVKIRNQLRKLLRTRNG